MTLALVTGGGSGIGHGRISNGLSGLDTVSPVSAEPSLVSAQMSPATQWVTSRRFEPSGESMCATRSSTSWSS